MNKSFFVSVGKALCAFVTLVLMTSCVNNQTIAITGNNNSVIQNNRGSVVGAGRDFINAPGVDELARRSSYGGGYREPSAPRCRPERPCSSSDELYFRRVNYSRELEMAQQRPVIYESSFNGDCYRGHREEPRFRDCNSGLGHHGGRLTGFVRTRVYRDHCERPIGQEQAWLPVAGPGW